MGPGVSAVRTVLPFKTKVHTHTHSTHTQHTHTQHTHNTQHTQHTAHTHTHTHTRSMLYYHHTLVTQIHPLKAVSGYSSAGQVK